MRNRSEDVRAWAGRNNKGARIAGVAILQTPAFEIPCRGSGDGEGVYC